MKEPSAILLQTGEAAVVFHLNGDVEGYIPDKELVEENSPTERAAFVLWCMQQTELLEKFRDELHSTVEKQ